VKITNAGEKIFLDLIMSGEVYTYHLITNAATLTDTMDTEDFIEANFLGYIAAPAIGWSAAVTNDDGMAESVAEQMEWTAGEIEEPVLIWGYYVTVGANLVYAQLSEYAPLKLNVPGDKITIIPKLILSTDYCFDDE
jgi:hypothetical protein